MYTTRPPRKTFLRRLRSRLFAQPLGSEKGISLIEVVIATVFVALIGIAISSSFLKMTRVSIFNRESKRAAALADMVFERYVVYASSNLINLNNYAVNLSSAAAFFGTPDNMGYDNFLITTNITTPAGSPNLRKVELTLTCLSLSTTQPFNFTTYLSPLNTNTGGASVDVYVNASPSAPIPNAPIVGALVTAPQFQSQSMVTALTDATGHAYLQNVQTSADGIVADIPITATAAGSDSTVPQASANYVQGYFVSVGNGKRARFSATQTFYANVQLVKTKPVYFNQFYPDYRQTGFVLIEPSNLGAGGVQINLTANAVQSGVSLNQAPFMVTSSLLASSLGAYEFNNILPGTIQINQVDLQGSASNIPPTSSSYLQGYSGDSTNNPSSIAVTYKSSPQNLPTKNLYVVSEGALAITTTDGSGNPVPSTNVLFTVLFNVNTSSTIGPIPTGSGATAGQLNLYNVIPYTQTVNFSASLPGGCGVGQFGTLSVSCQAGMTTSVPIVLSGGGTLTGQAWNGTAGVPNLNVATLALDGITPLTTTTDANGIFTFCNVGPLGPGNTLNITFSNATPVSVNFPAGTVEATEIYNNQAVPGATLLNATVGACPGTAGSVISDANGLFPAFCMNTNWQQTVSVKLVPPKGPNWGSVASPIQANINSNTATVPLEADAAPYFNPGRTTITVNNGIASGVNIIQPRLIAYPLSGTVQDVNSLAYLQGIPVASGSNGIVTDVNGAYTLVGRLRGRSSSSPGTVSASAGPGIATNNGYNYGTSNGNSPVAVPATFNLSVPVQINFDLVPATGSGTLI